MLTGNQYGWIVTNECGSVMLNISIVSCIGKVKLHRLRYTTFPSSRPVLGSLSSRVCGFMVLVCRQRPSLLMRDSHAHQSNPLQGWDDVFCLVQLTPLPLQLGEKQNHKNSNKSDFLSPKLNPQLSPNISLPSWLHRHPLSSLLPPSSHIQSFYRILYTHTHCYLIYWPGALVPAIRPQHSQRLCFTSLNPCYHHFSHQSCFPSCGLSNKTLTI